MGQMEQLQRHIGNEEWRRYGEARRKELVEQDEVEGGTSFHLNKKCRIGRYFALAERVVNQFKLMLMSLDSSNLEDTYIMGRRLVAYLSHALPQHPEYLSSEVSKQRNATLRDLVWINERMEALALKIDEEQLNKYITNDFVPEPDDDSSVSSQGEQETLSWDLEDSDSSRNNGRWESFPGWSFDISKKESDQPGMLDTDTSSSSLSEVNSSPDASTESRLDESGMIFHADFQTMNPQEQGEGYSDHDDDRCAEFHDEDAQLPELPSVHFSINEAVVTSAFLRKIADEDVRYETDSEAADSWAQDEESGALSYASSGAGVLTCDPARIAFQEIMNWSPSGDVSSEHAGSSPSSPSNSPSTAEDSSTDRYDYFKQRKENGGYGSFCEEGWASFDFATVRQLS